MTTASLGGLTGKARRVHRLDRADRAFAERLIEEYLEPDDASARMDRVPIRGRREFLPTLVAEVDMADNTTKSQLELPWDERREETPQRGGTTHRSVVWSTDPKERSAVAQAKQHVQPKTMSSGTTTDSGVLRVARQSKVRMPLAWAREPERRQPKPMNVRGFFAGCAIGGVAAALLLTVISVAVR